MAKNIFQNVSMFNIICPEEKSLGKVNEAIIFNYTVAYTVLYMFQFHYTNITSF